jgi:Predicted periplasmic lipoprotein (DUF2279)
MKEPGATRTLSLTAPLLAFAWVGAASEAFSLFPGESADRAHAPVPAGFSLRASLPAVEPPDLGAAVAAAAAAGAPEQSLPALAAPPQKTQALILTAGVLLGSAASALSESFSSGFVPFHVDNEFWFGKHTYTGGADKASHFVTYNRLARELHIAYGRMHYPQDRAYAMAVATSLGTGLITELGNAVGAGFGFSYEDLIMDSLGIGTAVFVAKHGLDDVVGFRFGPVPAPVPTPCCPFDELGKDYSAEVFTGDLKIAGVASRMGVNPGPARFLLLSMTYSTKGYKHSLPEFRQQQIGIEIGVNFPQILTELGVKDTTWWGRGLFIFFNFFRVPYTQIGYRYDFVHQFWLGPNIGQEYDPGPGAPSP